MTSFQLTGTEFLIVNNNNNPNNLRRDAERFAIKASIRWPMMHHWRLRYHLNRGKFLPIIRQHQQRRITCLYKPQSPPQSLTSTTTTFQFSTKISKQSKTNDDDDNNNNNNNTNNNYSNSQNYDVIASTKMWVDTIIVGERLCPFVMPLKSSNTLQYITSNATNIEQAVADIATQTQLLLPDHIIPSSNDTSTIRNIMENVCSEDVDLWGINDESDDDDDDKDDNNDGTISTAKKFNAFEVPNENDEDAFNKPRKCTAEIEHRVNQDISHLHTIDSDRAIWDILSEVQTYKKEREDEEKHGMDELRELIKESQQPDSEYQFISSIDEATPGMVKRHYQQVFNELEESILDIKPALPSRPHGATLVIFDAPFVQDYHDFEDLCEAVYRKIIYQMDYYYQLHIFIFHPQYVHTVYAVPKKFNAVDYVMRSPYPTILLIREIDMKAAYLSSVVPHIRQLSDRNKSRFHNQGAKTCIRRLEACYVPQQQNTDTMETITRTRK